MRRDVFQAIADPTRRAIIRLLAQQQMTPNEVSTHFEISRPAISKHIRILEECGLVVIRPQGRERYCEAQLSQLKEVARWTEQYRQFWSAKMDALDTHLKKSSKKPIPTKPKKSRQ